MKRILLACAIMIMATAAFAQKANVKKVKNMIEFAEKDIAPDLSNMDPKKREEMRTLISAALENEESMAMADTYKYAAMLNLFDMNQMLAERTANNNEFTDKKAFFFSQMNLVTNCERYYELFSSPDEKGKYEKPEKISAAKLWAQEKSKGARINVFAGAGQMVYEDPAFAIQALDIYYETFDNKLYADMDLRNTDKYYIDGWYIYGTALKATGGDEAKMLDCFNKAMDSNNAALACQDIISYYKSKGDAAGELKALENACETHPEILEFSIMLAQKYLGDKAYDKCISLCDKTMSGISNGSVNIKNNNGETKDSAKYPAYFKAVAEYSTDKFEQAYSTFEQGATQYSNNMDAIVGAGNCAMRLASNNQSDKALSKDWYTKAINWYKQAEELEPTNTDAWGYPLYACYHNIGDVANAKLYEQYNK